MSIEHEDIAGRLRHQAERSRAPDDAGLMREAAEAIEGLRLGYHNALKERNELRERIRVRAERAVAERKAASERTT